MNLSSSGTANSLKEADLFLLGVEFGVFPSGENKRAASLRQLVIRTGFGLIRVFDPPPLLNPLFILFDLRKLILRGEEQTYASISTEISARVRVRESLIETIKLRKHFIKKTLL